MLMYQILKRVRDIILLPYGLLFAHRSKLSHLPPWGTATRVLYLLTLIILLLWKVGFDFCAVPTWIDRLGLGCVLGLGVSDIAHALADCWPGRRRRKRKQ